ncbi:MAG: hypothetical protein AB7U83_16945 [Vicinamibacterales bacterium]
MTASAPERPTELFRVPGALAHWGVAPDGQRFLLGAAPCVQYADAMKGSAFDEIAFFDAVARSETRALLIGRRALVVLGFPVLTADYDFWIHIDDIERFNAAAAPFDLAPTRTPEEARRHGRLCPLTATVAVALPAHADLIATKRFASRPKDLEDIRLLELLGPEGEA